MPKHAPCFFEELLWVHLVDLARSAAITAQIEIRRQRAICHLLDKGMRLLLFFLRGDPRLADDLHGALNGVVAMGRFEATFRYDVFKLVPKQECGLYQIYVIDRRVRKIESAAHHCPH
jgi:hypothetical protein